MKFRSKFAVRRQAEGHARHSFTSWCAPPLPTEVLQQLLNTNDSQRGYSEDTRARADESNVGGRSAISLQGRVQSLQCADYCSILRRPDASIFLGMKVFNKRPVGVSSAIISSRVAPSAVSSKATTGMPRGSLLISAIERCCSQ